MPRLARALLPLLALPLVACGGFRREVTRHTVRIESDPPGAYVARVDASGRRSIGQAPLEAEVEVVEQTYEASKATWIAPVLLGASTAILGGLTFSGDDGVSQGVFGGLALTAAIGFLVALPVAIFQQAADGDVFSRSFDGPPPAFEGSLPGYASASVVLSVPELSDAPYRLALHPAGGLAASAGSPSKVLGVLKEGVVPGGLGGLGVRGGALRPAQRPVIAVFDIEDKSRAFGRELTDNLTDYLGARVTEEGRFRVVPRSELLAQLREGKASSYKDCFDERCQIELGKAVAASKVLMTKLIRVGEACAISATLFDLATEAAESAATVRTACAEQALMDGLEDLTGRLGSR